MTELTEQDKYALLANVPYLINEGVPIDDIILNLKEYGLDYKHDPEYTNTERATLIGENEIIHSIRGTADLTDILNDIKLGAGISKFFTTLSSKPYLQPSLRKGAGLMNYIPETTGIMTYIKSQAPRGYKQYIPKTLNPEIRSSSKFSTPIQVIKALPALPLVVGTTGTLLNKGVNKLIDSLYPESYDRFNTELELYDKIVKKYPTMSHTLTGHSLSGGISNHISRLRNVPAITFNPAPAHKNYDSVVEGSRVYRTNYDIVSYLRDEQEPEPITIVPQKGINPHSLSNFFPDKNIIFKNELKEPKTFLRMKDINKSEFDFCRFYPENPICKRNKVYF
jgi:hypothetical protein